MTYLRCVVRGGLYVKIYFSWFMRRSGAENIWWKELWILGTQVTMIEVLWGLSMMGPVDHGKESDSFINVMENLWKFFCLFVVVAFFFKENDIILFSLSLRGCFREEYLQILLVTDFLCRKFWDREKKLNLYPLHGWGSCACFLCKML